MDISQLFKVAQQTLLAGKIKGMRYAELTPEQRKAVEESLGYFDYFHGYAENETEETKKKKFDEAVISFVADNKLENLSSFQQFITLLFSFLSGNGQETDSLASALPAGGAEHNPSRQWSRAAPPRQDQTVILPGNISKGELGSTLPPPAATADKNGRYRLMTVATDAQASSTRTEMVVLDPAGKVVWRNAMNSGASSLEGLPGLRAQSSKAITTEYKIDWNDVRLDRKDALAQRAMSYSNGKPGFSFTLTNPDNLAEIGGAGRSAFRIHPGGRGVGTAGCLEFIDSNGGISTESDRAAQSFVDLMTSLPPSQRPVSLEVLNSTMLEQHRGIGTPQLATKTAPAKTKPEQKNNAFAALANPENHPTLATGDGVKAQSVTFSGPVKTSLAIPTR
ncbi:MAG: hypothetical protein ACOYNL_05640 [Rickettsiales bacterium]